MKLVSIFFKATSKILLKTTVQITGKRTPGKLEEQAF